MCSAAAYVAGADLVIFDFDGTLADSEDLLTELVLQTLRDKQLSPAIQSRAIGKLIGLPLLQVLSAASGAPAGELHEVASHYRHIADSPEVVARFRLFPGVATTLRTLADRGKRLAIATSKSRAITQKILVAVGLDDLVGEVVGGDCVRHGKPHPEAVERLLAQAKCSSRRAAVVGDTTFDVEMGKGAGAITIAATYGMHEREALATKEPDAFIDDIGELI